MVSNANLHPYIEATGTAVFLGLSVKSTIKLKVGQTSGVTFELDVRVLGYNLQFAGVTITVSAYVKVGLDTDGGVFFEGGGKAEVTNLPIDWVGEKLSGEMKFWTNLRDLYFRATCRLPGLGK